MNEQKRKDCPSLPLVHSPPVADKTDSLCSEVNCSFQPPKKQPRNPESTSIAALLSDVTALHKSKRVAAAASTVQRSSYRDDCTNHNQSVQGGYVSAMEPRSKRVELLMPIALLMDALIKPSLEVFV